MEHIIKFKDAQIEALQRENEALKTTNTKLFTIKNQAITRLKNLLAIIEEKNIMVNDFEIIKR